MKTDKEIERKVELMKTKTTGLIDIMDKIEDDDYDSGEEIYREFNERCLGASLKRLKDRITRLEEANEARGGVTPFSLD